MSYELMEAFDKLDINTKRNQISDELMIINEMIKNFEVQYNIKSVSNVKNYNQVSDKDLDESQMLTFFYEDIYNIQQELITLLTIVNNQNK